MANGFSSMADLRTFLDVTVSPDVAAFVRAVWRFRWTTKLGPKCWTCSPPYDDADYGRIAGSPTDAELAALDDLVAWATVHRTALPDPAALDGIRDALPFVVVAAALPEPENEEGHRQVAEAWARRARIRRDDGTWDGWVAGTKLRRPAETEAGVERALAEILAIAVRRVGKTRRWKEGLAGLAEKECPDFS